MFESFGGRVSFDCHIRSSLANIAGEPACFDIVECFQERRCVTKSECVVFDFLIGDSQRGGAYRTFIMAAPRSRWSNMRSGSSRQDRAQPSFGRMHPVQVVPFDEFTIKSNQWLFVTKHVVKVIRIHSLGAAGRCARG